VGGLRLAVPVVRRGPRTTSGPAMYRNAVGQVDASSLGHRPEAGRSGNSRSMQLTPEEVVATFAMEKAAGGAVAQAAI
jgi:hypothetical protein